jgi:hypothetical protein
MRPNGPASGTRSSPTVPARPRPAAPRSSEGEHLAIVKIEIHLHESSWLSRFSQRHPELLLEIHGARPTRRDHILADIEVLGAPNDWGPEISGLPGVAEVRHLTVPPEHGRYRVLYRQSRIQALVSELEVLVQYPQTVQNGVCSAEVVDMIGRIRRLVAALRASGYEARIVALRQQSLRSRRPNLTVAQREIFQQAVAAGYFDVPRQITLTRLAERLSRSKSSVSETLAVVERKLAESATDSAP